MKYYLYIDDSGKFEKEKDNHTLYSYLLLNKEQRKSICNEYLKIWDIIARPESPLSLKEKETLISQFNNKENRNLILGTQYPEKIKANDFIKQYNSSIKDNDKKYTTILKKFLMIYKIPTYIGTMAQSKTNSDIKNWDSEKAIIRKKQYLILVLLSNLVEKNVLKKDTEISIYIDKEFNSVKNEKLSNEFKKYLNFQPQFYNQNKGVTMQRKLRVNKIRIKNFSFIDSNYSIPIRLADLTANLSSKYFKKNKDKESKIDNIVKFLCENKIYINLCEFPHFISSVLKIDE